MICSPNIHLDCTIFYLYFNAFELHSYENPSNDWAWPKVPHSLSTYTPIETNQIGQLQISFSYLLTYLFDSCPHPTRETFSMRLSCLFLNSRLFFSQILYPFDIFLKSDFWVQMLTRFSQIKRFYIWRNLTLSLKETYCYFKEPEGLN